MEVVNSSEEFQDPYKGCIKYKDNECGEYTRWSKTGVYRRVEINWDIKDHLVNLKVNIFYFCFTVVYDWLDFWSTGANMMM